MKIIMTYLLCALALVALVLLIGKANLAFQFRKQVKQLFAESKSIADKTFTYKQLDSLPEPVQRYFKHVLKDGQPYISYVRLMHDGQFKIGLNKDWVNIEGEQYFTTEKPGFLWKGTTNMFVARDMYISDKGRLIASVLSLVNVVDVQGEQSNQGELLRWLSESIWFPTNLLPSERLKWSAIDAYSAKLTFDYKGLSLFFVVTFNDKNEILELETKRYMDEKRFETWICRADKYEEKNGIFIPTQAEALWRLAEGDFSYAKFNVTKIEYEKPQSF